MHPDAQAGWRVDDPRSHGRILTTEATVAQRVVRAKRTLAEAGAALEEPSEAERAERLTAVLSVIYLLVQRGLFGHSWQ